MTIPYDPVWWGDWNRLAMALPTSNWGEGYEQFTQKGLAMPIKYNPSDATTCLPPGKYQAILKSVEDTVSKNNNVMQHLVWSVFTPNGQTHLVDDFIVVPKTIYKLKKIARALGKLVDFERGTFQADNEIGCQLVLDLGVQSQPGYDDKNQVGGYEATTPDNFQPPPRPEDAPEQEIPF